jgi:hypothetical protein
VEVNVTEVPVQILLPGLAEIVTEGLSNAFTVKAVEAPAPPLASKFGEVEPIAI